MDTEQINELFKEAMKLEKYLTRDQLDVVQSMLVHFEQKNFLTERQIEFLRAIIKAAKKFASYKNNGGEDE